MEINHTYFYGGSIETITRFFALKIVINDLYNYLKLISSVTHRDVAAVTLFYSY